MPDVRTGLNILLSERLGLVLDRRVGLITNRSAVTADARPGIAAMLTAGVKLTALFAPEHGVRGDLAAGQTVPSSTDPETGAAVYSLYGANKKPSRQMLDGLDVLIFDIQDVGARFYTFLSTMAYAMEAAAENAIPFVVLDRPNPIGGLAVEGPILEPAFSSFVGLYPIPVRAGRTIGELALMFNSKFGIGAPLEMIPMDGWRRSMWFDDTGLPWVPPSPGIPDLATATVYPGTCLVEGTNLSEGRGTPAPFRTIGAPWIDGDRLAVALNASGIEGAVFETARFVPSASKFAGTPCGGIKATVTDREAFRPVSAGVKIIELARRLWPDEFSFNPPGPDGRHFFDLLAGTDSVRLSLEKGFSAEEIVRGWDASGFGGGWVYGI